MCIIRGRKMYFLIVPMPLRFVWLSHPAKEAIFNLTIYPIKISISKDCLNCPACEQRSVFIKRVSIVWTARPGIRGLISASAPDSVITPAEWSRCFKHPLNDFHTYFSSLVRKRNVQLLSCSGSNVREIWIHSPLDHQTHGLGQVWIWHLQTFPQGPHKVLVGLRR